MRDIFVRQPLPVLMVLVAAAFAGCSGPEADANRFLNRYYVSADLEQALTYATGSAAAKIKTEIEETREVRSMGGVTTGDRKINYEHVTTTKISEASMVLRYRVIVSSGGSDYPRDVDLTLVLQDGRWLVSDFADVELPAAATGSGS